MSIVYVDSSVIVAILFQEPAAKKFQKTLNKSEEIVSSYLLEAELYSAATREDVPLEKTESLLQHISFVMPERSLREEYFHILSIGYCRGADLHHIACALYLEPEKKELQFLTADHQQKSLAKKIRLNCTQ